MARHWLFYPNENRLVTEEKVAYLTGKAAAVLLLLTQRQGDLVSHEEILRSVWRGVHVTPDLVREYISDLRKVLGDNAKAPMHIETIRGKGFRLIGGVSFAERSVAGALQQRPRIAVLRPDLFGGGARWRHVADALGQEVIVDLARHPDLSVIGRHSSFAQTAGADLRETAAVLNADFLVTIVLKIDADRIQVAFELVDGVDGAILSVNRLDYGRCQLPELTGKIASRISGELGRFRGEVQDAMLEKIRRTPSANRNAYEEYLLSIECEHDHSLESWRRGLRHADRSIELDPNFARAWHMRCSFLRGLVNFFCDPQLNRENAFREAAKACRRSLLLDPRDPHIIAWSADLHVAEGNFDAARNALARAADLGRNQPDILAYCSIAFALLLGAFEEAMHLIDEALSLSPHPPEWYHFVDCRVAYFICDYTRCDAAAHAAPHGLPSMLFGALSLAMQGRLEEAKSAYAVLIDTYPDFSAEQYVQDMIVHPEASQRFLDGLVRVSGDAVSPNTRLAL